MKWALVAAVIRNDDMRPMMLAMVIAGIFAFVAEQTWRSDLLSGGRNRSGALPAKLIGVALIALAWALSQAIRFALSRTREYVADAGAAELTKDPDALISALIKISAAATSHRRLAVAFGQVEQRVALARAILLKHAFRPGAGDHVVGVDVD